ncbi:hypothetical protein [Arthrobacter sp. UYCo732]|uniref:hypothetical protein n=1 Tax=Arthrobacter sp. UYCo732 TaxID=3156336 RepID=UPI003391F05E
MSVELRRAAPQDFPEVRRITRDAYLRAGHFAAAAKSSLKHETPALRQHLLGPLLLRFRRGVPPTFVGGRAGLTSGRGSRISLVMHVMVRVVQNSVERRDALTRRQLHS